MNVRELYDKYNIPPNLQKHMLRVAALSQILVENWKDKTLNKTSIVFACLFHDMANIIKFDFDKTPLFKEEKKQTNYWESIQKEMICKYGKNIHNATLQICQEISLSEKILYLIEKLEWNNSLDVIKQNDFESMICIYCDMRVGPFGILSIHERIQNLQTRNSTYNFDFIKKSAPILEKSIQNNMLIQVSSITNTQLNSRFNTLLQIKV